MELLDSHIDSHIRNVQFICFAIRGVALSTGAWTRRPTAGKLSPLSAIYRRSFARFSRAVIRAKVRGAGGKEGERKESFSFEIGRADTISVLCTRREL